MVATTGGGTRPGTGVARAVVNCAGRRLDALDDRRGLRDASLCHQPPGRLRKHAAEVKHHLLKTQSQRIAFIAAKRHREEIPVARGTGTRNP